MVTVEGLEQYRALQRRRLEMYERNTKRGSIRGAEIYATRLRMYVPQKTGRLKRSIIRRGSNVRIGAPGSKGFPYIHWINQTPGMGLEAINMKRNKRTGKFTDLRQIRPTDGPIFKAVYGSMPANWRWTGQVRFAEIALQETRQQWRVLIQKVNKKSIMVQSI